MPGSEILISKTLRETRVAKLENGQLVELQIERSHGESMVGNIYLGRVARVLPGMQAAFLDIGAQRTAFLHASHVPNPAQPSPPGFNAEMEEDDSAAEDEESSETAPASRNPARQPQKSTADISQLLKEGQQILVQVVKEPLGTKGARLTGHLSLAGRYLVCIPEGQGVLGVSRRIENSAERGRLKEIVESNLPKQGGFIIRTVAEGASAKNLKDDMEYLLRLWGTIKKQREKAKAPAKLFSEFDIVSKVIRDRVTDDVEKIVIDDLESFKRVNKFVQNFLPRFKKRVTIHTEGKALFDFYGIETEITRSLSPKVWLKSGGYIVIDQTEALTSIDVNTGRFVGRRNVDETVFHTNMEALKEIAYQIRLRNLGGIIVADFIDMESLELRQRVYDSFKEELAKDPVRTHVLPLSELGLIEMTRKRTQASLLTRLTSPCKYCEGRGYLKSRETLLFEILRQCRKEALSPSAAGTITLYCHPAIAELFAEEERLTLEELETQLAKRIVVKEDPQLHLEDYEIFSREV